MSILNQSEINQIVEVKTRDPFSLLGMHNLNREEVVIRVFRPDAKNINIISDFLKRDIKLEMIHEDGLFERVIAANDVFDYQLEIENYQGYSWKIKDPYSFLPVLSDYDLHLFNEGNHHRIYEKMGAHLTNHQGVAGVHFSVWAPEAQRVSVIGEFNDWDGRVNQMRLLGASGVWEIFIPDLEEEELYRFEVKTKEGHNLLKSDPYAFYSELRPSTASIIYNLDDKYEWQDQDWLEERRESNWLERPISVYEVNLGSWARVPEEENRFLTYKELADKLVKYVKENNYTHVELMPISEFPFDQSWGYQVTGYYSATSRFGKPEDLMYLIDIFHQHGIGVILDWVPGHFPKDAHGLGRFDGTALYEHADPRQGEHVDWGTYIFNYGRNEVKNFLIANALFWLEKYHIDGLRVDAVASMIYLDYGREEGEWVANKYGGKENLEAIEFLKYFNSVAHNYYPGILTIAEESTAWPGVSNPTYLGGLGFSLKWNMGWMHDALEYIQKDSIYRKYHHNNLTFPLMYAFNENFMLVISHDEVVHLKKAMLDKMPGDYWQKFANLRLFYSYMYAHPGKKLLFMGGEFGQWDEWNDTQSLDWNLLEYDSHRKLLKCIRDLNGIYRENKALWQIDFSPEGFEWIDCHDADNSIISFIRKGREEDEFILCIFNFTPVKRDDYRVGVPKEGFYEEIFNSDSQRYWGNNLGNMGGRWAEPICWQNRSYSITLTLPPLSGIYFKYRK